MKKDDNEKKVKEVIKKIMSLLKEQGATSTTKVSSFFFSSFFHHVSKQAIKLQDLKVKLKELGFLNDHIQAGFNKLNENLIISVVLKAKQYCVYILSNTDREAKTQLTDEENQVLHEIEKAGTKGAWMAQIKKNVVIQSNKVEKILKSLIKKKIIKQISQIGARNKIYILFDLEADTEITGDIWYSEGDFDEEFVDKFLKTIIRQIKEHSKTSIVKFFFYF